MASGIPYLAGAQRPPILTRHTHENEQTGGQLKLASLIGWGSPSGALGIAYLDVAQEWTASQQFERPIVIDVPTGLGTTPLQVSYNSTALFIVSTTGASLTDPTGSGFFFTPTNVHGGFVALSMANVTGTSSLEFPDRDGEFVVKVSGFGAYLTGDATATDKAITFFDTDSVTESYLILPSSGLTWRMPSVAGTMAVTDGAQTWSASQTYTVTQTFKPTAAEATLFDGANASTTIAARFKDSLGVSQATLGFDGSAALSGLTLNNGATGAAGSVIISQAAVSAARNWAFPDASGATFVGTTATQTLTNKTLTTPTIASLTNAQHTHQSAAGGGTLDAAAIAAGTLPVARGGTGVTASTGSTNVVLSGSPTIVTPTIASLTNMQHTHTNAAGGGVLAAAAIGVTAVNLTAQVADIGATNLATVAGKYLVTCYIATSTADAAAGTASVTLGWTDDAGATTQGFSRALTALGRNNVTQPVYLYLASGNLTYTVTHSGSYGTAQYALRIRVVPLG